MLDISDLLQESFRWRYNTENNKPSLLIDIPKKKEKKISGWQRFRRENFKGYRLITFHIREFLRSIKNHSESKKDEIKKPIGANLLIPIQKIYKKNIGNY